MSATATTAQALHDLFDRHHQYIRKNTPEFATYEGDHRYNDRLSDLSARSAAETIDQFETFRGELLQIEKSDLDKQDQLNYDMFLLLLEQTLDAAPFHEYELALNQMTGYHLELPQLIDFQPLKTEAQYQDYFSRLEGFPQQVSDVIDNLKSGMANGRTTPKHLMLQVLPQIQSLVSGEAVDSVFYIPLKQNETFAKEVKAKLHERLVELIDTLIKPTYQDLHDFVENTYLPACRETFGVYDLPEGDAYYRYCIKLYTTPELTADDIHAMGLKEVERIEQAKADLKVKLGFEGSTQEFNHHLRTSPEFAFDTVEALWQKYEAVMEEAYEKTPALFHQMPKAPCILKPVEDYKAKSAPQAYYMPAPEDGSRPGAYYLNTHDLPSRPSYAVTALTLHEAIPGHHLQIALAQELEGLPYFRRNMHVTAYIEGWGLYSEYLGYDMNMYNDPYQHYGALSFEMWRACRLVVDTGLHAKKWSRQEAIDFMQQHMANSEADIASEVDRYMILPGQALSYKVGEIKIKQLRQRAEDALGDRFDIRDFHDVVIRNGSVPLEVLENEVNAWLEAV